MQFPGWLEVGQIKDAFDNDEQAVAWDRDVASLVDLIDAAKFSVFVGSLMSEDTAEGLNELTISSRRVHIQGASTRDNAYASTLGIVAWFDDERCWRLFLAKNSHSMLSQIDEDAKKPPIERKGKRNA